MSEPSSAESILAGRDQTGCRLISGRRLVWELKNRARPERWTCIVRLRRNNRMLSKHKPEPELRPCFTRLLEKVVQKDLICWRNLGPFVEQRKIQEKPRRFYTECSAKRRGMTPEAAQVFRILLTSAWLKPYPRICL